MTYFVQKSIAHGIDILRIFDALNDLRNLETSVKAAKKEGGHVQLAMSYTLGEAYTKDYWLNLAKNMENMLITMISGYMQYVNRTTKSTVSRSRRFLCIHRNGLFRVTRQ